MEIWKEIPGYEGFYEASTIGRIRSLNRVVRQHNGNTQTKKGVILKSSIDRIGYENVALSRENKLKSFKVHRLVAMSFIDKVEGQNEINHIDCNKLNNNVANLEWCNRLQNIKHAIKNNLIKYHYGDSHHSNIVKSKDHSKINEMYYNEGKRVKDIANIYKCSQHTIYKIIKINQKLS